MSILKQAIAQASSDFAGSEADWLFIFAIMDHICPIIFDHS